MAEIAAKKSSGAGLVVVLLVGAALALSHAHGSSGNEGTAPGQSGQQCQTAEPAKTGKCQPCKDGKHRQCEKLTYNKYRDFMQCCDGIPIKRGQG